MKVHEHDARAIFQRHGLPVPESRLAASAEEAAEAAGAIAGRVVVKAQVLAGGRGKAGGVSLADSPAEAGLEAARILDLEIGGEPVRKVLIAPAVDIARELYLGVVIDRTAQSLALMASAEGGVDIEEVAATNPSAILRVKVDPLAGLPDWEARQLGFALGLSGAQVRQFVRIAQGLVEAFVEVDASLAEVNPLVVDADGNLQAIDAKLNIDDNALARQPEVARLRDPHEESEAERRARGAGLSYIKLDGTIGCMVNGAGLAMATMDVIKHYGGEPANFLDVGGGAGVEKITTAFEIILEDPNVGAVLVNIFAGITRADDVAAGVIAARAGLIEDIPLVVRVAGTREAEALELLEEAGIGAERSMDAAAAQVVEAAR
ncbi:MAG: ADP-forming succinate--CoA ligase subunit beta [Chloroflexi bacterium]|nr:ADP-forming succinate--CoA ligase subunit beta [Chloroflexota bacterium]MCY3957978.1 ADP-forming succinate--CoA ligase subunit beta [Chloroflexota bacterium]